MSEIIADYHFACFLNKMARLCSKKWQMGYLPPPKIDPPRQKKWPPLFFGPPYLFLAGPFLNFDIKKPPEGG